MYYVNVCVSNCYLTVGSCIWHDISIQSDPDSGKSEVTEEVYENQSRSPFAKWPSGAKGSYWTDKVQL